MRPIDWPEQLSKHVAAWATRPFAYGETDCVTFAAAWLERMGYADPLDGIPKWNSALGAARAFGALGGFDAAIEARMAALGCPRIPITFAMRGDIVLVKASARTRALGICDGRDVAVLAPSGMKMVPLIANAVAAWKL